jgi:hypothetical protein
MSNISNRSYYFHNKQLIPKPVPGQEAKETYCFRPDLEPEWLIRIEYGGTPIWVQANAFGVPPEVKAMALLLK